MAICALKSRIQEDMKTAMRAQDKQRLAVIRLILAALKQIEVDERIELDDARVIQILDKMTKQRRESIAQFNTANRKDLVDSEQFELDTILNYMPTPLTEAEIDQLIQTTITAVGAKGPQDMGKVMGALKPQIQGRADGTVVSGKVKAKLSS